ncbi:BQ5605_C004g03047 [Microbotryum silenes-dioicae]|uniref:BQ5605_C004g03047 protein n=1 Tax=Microbotryum silenes-dioicae TaxID=796604 RepID=A0A2X0MDP9_9BASI|nr:BQ5605_C004g03047 [Microbotryum silenes-dioicae]
MMGENMDLEENSNQKKMCGCDLNILRCYDVQSKKKKYVLLDAGKEVNRGALLVARFFWIVKAGELFFFCMKLIANLQDEKTPYGTKGDAAQYAR